MQSLESNLNYILDHCLCGKDAGNFAERMDEVQRHARLAKESFDWIDNHTVIKEDP
jgi:hypothetical protein